MMSAGFTRTVLAFCCAAAIGWTAVPAQSAAITFTDAQGQRSLEDTPKRVLVLDAASLDTLEALGVEPVGVVGSSLPDYLSKFSGDKYLKVGSLFEPDYEAVAAAKGDLMIVAGRSSPKFKDLSRILPTVDLTVDTKNFLGGVENNIRTLGLIFGRPARAAEMIATLNAKVAALKSVTGDAGTALLLVTNAGKVGAYGPTSRIGWLHQEIGFKPVSEKIDDRFHGGDIVTFEFLQKANPDWMFVIDRDAAIGQNTAGHAARQVLDNDLVHQTTAWKKGQIVYLDPQAAYISPAGYTALCGLIDQVYAAILAKK